jgi:hypothetical protein
LAGSPIKSYQPMNHQLFHNPREPPGCQTQTSALAEVSGGGEWPIWLNDLPLILIVMLNSYVK